MRELLLMFAIMVTTPVTDENETGWQVHKRAGLEFQHRTGNQRRVVLAVQGPRIARGTYGVKFEIRF